MPPDLELLLLLLLWAGWCELDEEDDVDAAAGAESESPWARLTAKVVLEAVESLLAVLSCLDLLALALALALLSGAVALSHGSSPASTLPLPLLPPRDEDVTERMLLLPSVNA